MFIGLSLSLSAYRGVGAPYVSLTGLTLGSDGIRYAVVGDDIDADVLNLGALTVSSWSIELDGVEDATTLPYEVPDQAGDTLEFIATLSDASTVTSGIRYIGKLPAITATFAEGGYDDEDTLTGADLTLTVVDAGYPVLAEEDVVDRTLLVDTAPTALPHVAATGEDLQHYASFEHVLGTVEDTSDVEVVGGAAPALNSVVFVPGGSGTPDSLTIGYSGDATGFLPYIGTGNDPFTVTAAQLYAGSGGTGEIEFTSYTLGTDISITGLTSASEAADRIAVALIRSSDGGLFSAVLQATVSGLDFTAPTLDTAETDVAGTTVTLTLTENIFGTEDTADWTVEINSTPQTPSAVNITGDTVDLTITAPAFGDTVTVSYSGGDLVDSNGNALAGFTDQAVTNNVPETSTVGDLIGVFHQSVDIETDGTTQETTSDVFPGAGTWLVQIFNNGTGPDPFTLSGAAISASTLLHSQTNSQCHVLQYLVTTSGASNLIVTATTASTSFHRVIAVLDATGLTATGHLEVGGTATNSGTVSAGPTSSVPDGDHVFGAAMNRAGSVATGSAWSGDFAGGDEKHDQTFSENTTHRATGAYFQKSGAGTVSGTVTWTTDDGSSTSAMSIVALAEA